MKPLTGRISVNNDVTLQLYFYVGDKMNTRELISEAVSLPVEERALVVDSLLRSLNQPESEIDKKWAVVAKRRLVEMRSGTVSAVPGEQVFERIWHRFDK
ncbi:MAG: addiction module protein [Candidatus Polarisedimenticolaceae bacterium]|nr:addiction module protein [Candidatus Polarisedimenticolaceae bacterium]